MSQSDKKELYLIADGWYFTLEYFIRNGVYPNHFVLDLNKFVKNLIPYINPQDDVLIVVNGLTDLNLSDVYRIMHEIKSVHPTYDNVKVFTNVHLGVVDFPFYEYSGDLFYSPIKVHGAKGNTPPQKKKAKGKSDTLEVNEYMREYLSYTKVNPTVYAQDDEDEKDQLESVQKGLTPTELHYLNAIKVVDYFNNQE